MNSESSSQMNSAVSTKDISRVEFDTNVTRIEKGAFEECENLHKVIIPEGITQIEDNAFKNCANLTINHSDRGQRFLKLYKSHNS